MDEEIDELKKERDELRRRLQFAENHVRLMHAALQDTFAAWERDIKERHVRSMRRMNLFFFWLNSAVCWLNVLCLVLNLFTGWSWLLNLGASLYSFHCAYRSLKDSRK